MRLAISGLILSGALLFAGGMTAQEAAFPRIVQHAHAEYPPDAVRAQIQGDVMVKFTTDGRSVLSAEATSGPTVLQGVCVDNVKTWKFGKSTPGTFQAIFRFKILAPDHPAEDMFPGLPNLIEVVAVAPAQ